MTVRGEEMAELVKAFVRPYQRNDRDAVAHVCLATGSEALRNNKSPTPTLPDEAQPEALLPHLQIHPYTALYPEFCFVLVAGESVKGNVEEGEREDKKDAKERVVGYIVGTPDTVRWFQRVEDEYFPSQLLARPWMGRDWKAEEGSWRGRGEQDVEISKKLLSILHNPADAFIASQFPDLTTQYPAHFNTAILPEYAGKGFGRKLQEALWEKLRSEGISGLHLEGREGNTNATEFYRHLGFKEWEGIEGGVYELNGVRGRVMCMKL